MEAVTAIGLATSIIQLIEIARNITSTAGEINRSVSGLSKEFQLFRNHAAFVCQDVDLIIQAGDDSEYDSQFRDHASTFRKYVQDYLQDLDSLKIAKTKDRAQLLKAAMKIRLRGSHLEESMSLIQKVGDQITIHFVAEHLPTLSVKLDNLQAPSCESESRMSHNIVSTLFTLNQYMFCCPCVDLLAH